jgi:hypothetical protein
MGERLSHPIGTILLTGTLIILAIVAFVALGWANRQEPDGPYAPPPSATATQE